MSENIAAQITEWNRLYKELNRVYHTLALHSGISSTDFWILYALYETKEPMTQNDLCELWCYPKQTVHSVIQKLLEKKYLILQPAKKARNSKIILFTDAGKAFCQKMILPVMQAEERAFAHLPAEEWRTFLQISAKLTELLKEEITPLTGTGGNS